MSDALRKVLKRLHPPVELMLACVRWYAAYPLSLRNLEKMTVERGVVVDHTTVHRWQSISLPVPAPAVAVAALVALAILGGLAAKTGGTRLLPGVMRITFWTAFAVAVTYAVGTSLGTTAT